MGRPPAKPKANPRWFRFTVRQRGDKWFACFPDPQRTKSRRKNGRVYREAVEHEVPLHHPDDRKTPAGNAAEAYHLAETVYDWLERKRIELRERAAVEEETLTAGKRVRWPIAGSIQDWLDRPNIKSSTRESARAMIKPLQELVREKNLEFLDEITFDHGLELRVRLQERVDSEQWSPNTANDSLTAARGMLEWCRKKLRVPLNTFRIGEIESFPTQPSSPPVRYLAPHDRQRLLAACNNTQERLIYNLTTLVGLRNAEAAHLKWGNFISDVTPPELDIRYSEPDEDDPEGWDPKTGERIVSLHWPETIQLLKLWRSETAHAIEPDAPILADPVTGKAYRHLPKRLHQRLQRETSLPWTPQVGRRIACTLMVVHAHRLTGEPWSVIDHQQHFGHSASTANNYYIDRKLNRVRRWEADPTPSDEDEGVGQLPPTGFSVDLARQLLEFCIRSRGCSRNALARAAGVSFNAVKKFFNGGQSVPAWYWRALSWLSSQ
ncbi:MAG: hypothetical protein AB7S36_17380 [Planctomycetota bacterium]